MLTGQQLMVTTTRRRDPPYRLQELRNIFNVPGSRALSLRAMINLVQAQKLLFFVQVRDISLLSLGFDKLTASWDSSAPSVETLRQLSRILATFGASIVFVSTDKKVVGISGNIGGLAMMPAMRITPRNVQDVRDIAAAEAATGTALIATAGILAASGGAALAPAFLAAGAGLEVAAAGAYIYVVIADGGGLGDVVVLPMLKVGDETLDPVSGAMIPRGVEFGALPPGADASTLIDDPPISIEFPEGPAPPVETGADPPPPPL